MPIKYFYDITKTSPSQKIGDRDFRNKFRLSVENEIKITEFEKGFLEMVEGLTKNFPSDRQKAVITPARQRYFESFIRLILRSAEVKEIEWEIYFFDENLKSSRPLKDLQTDLVDKTEAFHQQVYASISAFIKLLSFIAPKDFKSNMPIKKNSAFLAFLKQQLWVCPEMEIIEKSSNEYRVRYVDHTSQHRAHDWYTASEPDGKAFIVYFEGRGKGVFADLTKELQSPIPTRSLFPAEVFFVPPHHSDVLRAYTKIVLETLKFIMPQPSHRP